MGIHIDFAIDNAECAKRSDSHIYPRAHVDAVRRHSLANSIELKQVEETRSRKIQQEPVQIFVVDAIQFALKIILIWVYYVCYFIIACSA